MITIFGVIFVLIVLAVGCLIVVQTDGDGSGCIVAFFLCAMLSIIGFRMNETAAQNNEITRTEIIPEDRYFYDDKPFTKVVYVRGEGTSIIWTKKIKSYEELDMFNAKSFLVIRKYVNSAFLKDYPLGYYMVKKSEVEKSSK